MWKRRKDQSEHKKKIKDVRKYIDKFVNDNEILYSEAKEIIERFENDGIDITDEGDKNNNNEDDNKFKSSKNTINKISNIKKRKEQLHVQK